MLSLDHKEFGLYPKMDRKPLKHFDRGGNMIRFVFSKLSLAAMQGGEDINRAKGGIVRMPQLYSRMVAAVEMKRN